MSAGVLSSSARRASVWAIAGYAAGQALRLAGNLVLWKLLFPEAFGMMAIVNVFMQGLQMFSDVGIGPSIVQNARGDEPDYLNTAWTIQVVRGFVLFVASVALSLPIATFYGEPQLAPLVAVAGLGSIFSGFNSTRLFTATRQISLGRLTLIEILSQVVALVLMVAWAYLRPSIWALVTGSLAGTAARLALSHVWLMGIRNRFRWDPTSARTLIHFGRWVFLSTLLSFAVMQSDRLIFGRLVPLSILGVYSIATVWATLPCLILDRVFTSVVFPLLSKIHREEGDTAGAFRKARFQWLMGTGFLSACLLAGAPWLVRLLYDERAEAAGWVVRVLCAGGWFLALETTNGTALLALGKANWVAFGSGAKLIGMIAFIPLGYHWDGFRGAVIGFTASELLRYVVSATGVTTHRLSAVGQDVLLSLGLAASTGAAWGVANAAIAAVEPSSLRLSATLGVLAVGLVNTVLWGLVFLVHRAAKASR